MQADAYAGFSKLYEVTRKQGPIIEAACWAHGRRKFFDLARLSKAPIALEAVKRIDVLFGLHRSVGLDEAEHRVQRARGRGCGRQPTRAELPSAPERCHRRPRQRLGTGNAAASGRRAETWVFGVSWWLAF
jgi:hypothetical protein